MWRAAAGHKLSVSSQNDDDDWETEADFVNDTTEDEQRWGSKTVEGSGHVESFDMEKLRNQVQSDHTKIKQKEFSEGPKASEGYGGKFGVQKDRMDKSAVSHDYQSELAKHSSQTDVAKGFGGKFGVQKDRQDKVAVDYTYKAKLEQHQSQKDHSKGFGGKYGVESEKVDKSAVGWEYKAKLEQHASQKDHSVGFGGKYGVETDKQDKSAEDWNYQSSLATHASQTDTKKGFGGKFGVESDRVDKSAHGYSDQTKGPSTNYEKQVPVGSSTGAKSLKSRFEQLAEDQKVVPPKPAPTRQWKKPVQTPTQPPPDVSRDASKQTPQKLPDVIQFEPEDTYATHNNKISPEVDDGFTEDDKQEEDPYDDNQEENPYDEGVLTTQPTEQEYKKDEIAEPEPETTYDEARFGENEYNDISQANQEGLYEPVETVVAAADQSNTLSLTARAIFDYQADGEDEISFDPDDIITNIEEIDDGWWMGDCHGIRGLFPANYVELIS